MTVAAFSPGVGADFTPIVSKTLLSWSHPVGSALPPAPFPQSKSTSCSIWRETSFPRTNPFSESLVLKEKRSNQAGLTPLLPVTLTTKPANEGAQVVLITLTQAGQMRAPGVN